VSYYGRASARLYSLLIDPLLRKLRERITSLCIAEGVTAALDIACATGAQCRSLHSAGIRSTGIDLAPEMIAAARRISPPEIEYLIGSALELPFPDGTFPGAILSLCLHEHPFIEQDRMVAEAVRVTRPGGAVIVAEYSPPRRPRPEWWLINAIERVAGKEHFRNFRKFVRAGGIVRFEPLLPSIGRRVPIFGGGVTILVARVPKRAA